MIIEVFLIFLFNFVLARRLKYTGFQYHFYLTYSDIFYSYLMSLIFTIFFIFNISILFSIFFIVLNILLFLDIALFQVYQINLDYSSLKLFILNPKSFLKNSDNTLSLFIISKKLYLFPIFVTLIIFIFYFHDFLIPWLIFSYFLYLIFQFGKVKFKISSIFLYFILLSALGIYFSNIYVTKNLFFNSTLYLGIFLILLIFKYLFRNIDNTFFQVECKMLDFFNLGTKNFTKPKKQYQDFEKIVPLKFVKTKNSNKLKNSNIIFITIESLNKKIFSELIEEKKYTFLKDFNISSKHHFAISSNTYESLQTIYNGSYKEKDIYPFIEVLNENSYKTIFFTPQGLKYEDTMGILNKSEFSKIISSDDKNNDCWLMSDGKYYKDNYQILKEAIGADKYFLHILNSQTHTPYKICNNDKNKIILQDKIRYKTSLNEALDELDSLFLKMKKDNLLENTLIIFTGDHGESFGELEYNVHSTTSTKEQIDIPFLMKHTDLKKEEFCFSSHFDILPTILSLLGLELNTKTLGVSLFEQNSQGFISYSKTKSNKISTSFAFVSPNEGGRKIFIDLMFQRFWILDFDDRILKVLKGEEKKEILWALKIALKERNLIG